MNPCMCKGTGVHSRYEDGRGMVEWPCAICRYEEHKAKCRDWKPAPKPPKPPEAQQSMFEEKRKTEEYPG